MEATINLLFQKFKDNLNIKDYQENNLNSLIEEIKAEIGKKLQIESAFIEGSYVRKTIIPPINESNIDVFLILSSSYFSESGQLDVLNKVKDVFIGKYQESSVSKNGYSVNVKTSAFNLDIVPCFTKYEGGIMIANTNKNKWITTDPKIYTQTLKDEDVKQNGKLVEIIKMIKSWNKVNNYPFLPFYLEALCIGSFKSVPINDYSIAIVHILNEISQQALKKFELKDISNSFGTDNLVYGLFNADFLSAQKIVELAYYHAAKAQEESLEDAVNTWKNMFGEFFPTLEQIKNTKQ